MKAKLVDLVILIYFSYKVISQCYMSLFSQLLGDSGNRKTVLELVAHTSKVNVEEHINRAGKIFERVTALF